MPFLDLLLYQADCLTPVPGSSSCWLADRKLRLALAAWGPKGLALRTKESGPRWFQGRTQRHRMGPQLVSHPESS